MVTVWTIVVASGEPVYRRIAINRVQPNKIPSPFCHPPPKPVAPREGLLMMISAD